MLSHQVQVHFLHSRLVSDPSSSLLLCYFEDLGLTNACFAGDEVSIRTIWVSTVVLDFYA